MEQESKRGTIVIFYNEVHAPYQVFVYPDNVDQVRWLMRHFADLATMVEYISFRRNDYRFELLLSGGYAKQPNVFVHKHLHEPMKKHGYRTDVVKRLHELESS